MVTEAITLLMPGAGPPPQTVSYTHLDVYKRQVPSCELPQEGQRRSNPWVYLKHLGALRSHDQVNSNISHKTRYRVYDSLTKPLKVFQACASVDSIVFFGKASFSSYVAEAYGFAVIACA